MVVIILMNFTHVQIESLLSSGVVIFYKIDIYEIVNQLKI
jgi:hypothetical protein